MAKDLEMGYLLDFYGEVLTEKQREMLRQYYNDDLSLSEIGENFGITRQGARDAIKHGENALKELEEKVGFAARYRRVQQKLEELEQMVIDARFECTGPQGLTAALTGGASAMCYTSEDVMAATFNVDLINEVGKCIGEDCLAMGYSGLYGPGINMHRTAYSGRNFEYYAEDPFVACTICAAEVQGIQSKGVYVYLKHVALNDSETSRRGVNTWLNEQTAREIYLEVADKAITDGGAWCVMTGFNRWGATWCGANANLLTGFLRGELGMRGMCITDFSGSSQYMDLVDGLIAGSDIWDSPMPKIHTTKAANYENDAYIVTQMRNAMHHILYTVVNSNAMNGWASTDTLKTITPWWQTAIYALIAVMAVLTILCAWQLSKALKAKKSMVDTAPAADQK